MEGLPENFPEFEESYPIYLLTKATKIPRGTTTYVSKVSTRYMLQMDFSLFNIERIHGFHSNSLTICTVTSHPFGLQSRRKISPIDILKCLVTKLSNQNKKITFIRVDGDVVLERSSEFMKTFHRMNTIVHTIGGYAPSLSDKRESPNKILDNITRALLLK